MQVFQKVLTTFYCTVLLSNASAVLAKESDMRSTIHPLIGFWESVDQNTGCKETYQFNSDGTGEFTSGKEVTKVTYEADAQPNLNGFFKLKHTVESSNGEYDCTQAKSAVKELQTSYILFQPDGYSYIACDTDEASLESCFGPMKLKSSVNSQ